MYFEGPQTFTILQLYWLRVSHLLYIPFDDDSIQTGCEGTPVNSITCTVNVLKCQTTFSLYLFSNKMLVIRAEIHTE